jgi:hypothetical protein
MFRRGTHRHTPIAGRATAGARLVRGLAAATLSLGGIVVAGLATTATPAGAATPASLIYEIDGGANAINVFPSSAGLNSTPSVHITAKNGSLAAPLGAAFDANGNLWVANSGGSIVELTSTDLQDSGSPSAAVDISDSALPTAVAFDSNGNLWVTTETGGIQEFAKSQLTPSGSQTPAVTIANPQSAWGLAFNDGNLWVGTYGGSSIVEYPAGQQNASGTPVIFPDLYGAENPAFDSYGDMWFSAPDAPTAEVAGFTANQLTLSPPQAPEGSLTGTSIASPAGLAFDSGDNLWAADQGSGASPAGTNGVYEYTQSQLSSGTPQTPTNSITSSDFVSPTDVLVQTVSTVSIGGVPTNPTYSAGGGFTATVSTNSNGITSLKSSTPAVCTVSGFVVSYVAAGQCTLTAQVAPTATYAQGSGTQSFTVASPPATTPPTTPPPPVTTPSTSSHGYWLVGSDGGIFSFGSAQFYGSTGSLKLQRPVVGIVPTADHGGYWLDASDGGVFSYGDTQFYGSIPGLGLHPAGSGEPSSLNAPIVGMVPSHDGGGYFMVASDGGVFAFGDAHFAGSCPGIGGCSGAAVAVMPDASGNGYWLVTATGNVYTFGNATYFGAPGHGTVTSAVATPDGKGYWILLSTGQVFAYGDAANLGSPAASGFSTSDPAATIFATADGGGYWVSSALGAVSNFGDAPNNGGMAGTHLNGSIIAGTGF